MAQAEKDKQEYESLRKIYEDDAAARARGEAVPDRPQFAEIQSSIVDPPKSLLEPKDKKAEGTIDPTATTFTFAHQSTPDPESGNGTSAAPSGFDASLEIDEFHGFDDMDLTGLEGMTGHGETNEGQWNDLRIMESTASTSEPVVASSETALVAEVAGATKVAPAIPSDQPVTVVAERAAIETVQTLAAEAVTWAVTDLETVFISPMSRPR